MAKSKRKVSKVSAHKNNSAVEVKIKSFSEAPEGKQFVLNDGRILKNIKELADALEHMSNDVYAHHVNQDKNDFASWTEDVLYEKDLAEDLQQLDNQLHAQIAVLKHIAKKAF
jgi:hypothetical protein